MSDPLIIAGHEFCSRLFLGTAGYPNRKVMLDAVAASGTAMVTASIRRISLAGDDESLIDILGGKVKFLPNTAGCQTAKDAILTAELAREALDTNWIKLEVIGDRELLYPDVEELIRATEELVAKGFVVLPYCTEDPVTCRKLADAGAAAVMPLGSPIGSGLGISNPHLIELVCARSPVPVVLDAGIGTASDATLALELGCAAVLINTAVSKAQNPVLMAKSMRAAVEAGRLSRLAGRIAKKHPRRTIEPAIRAGRHLDFGLRHHLPHHRDHLAPVKLDAMHDLSCDSVPAEYFRSKRDSAERLGGRGDLARHGFRRADIKRAVLDLRGRNSSRPIGGQPRSAADAIAEGLVDRPTFLARHLVGVADKARRVHADRAHRPAELRIGAMIEINIRPKAPGDRRR